MNRQDDHDLRQQVLAELARPGAISFIESFPDIGHSGVCGGCEWKCQHTHKSVDAATNCLNRHLAKKHGLED